jgi:large conductance mechanosensitive channel
MGLLRDFKQFAIRGNAVDLAVAVIIGAAFGKVISSLVEDIVLPPIGRVLGNVDFSSLYFPLSSHVPTGLSLAEARKLGPVFAWGNFVTVTINFIIIVFCVFLMVKAMSALQRKQETKPEAPPAPTGEEKLLTEIRDLLKERR